MTQRPHDKDDGDQAQANLTRRDLLRAGAAATAAAATPELVAVAEDGKAVRAGRIRQSVCRWCFGKIEADRLFAEVTRLGYGGIDLADPADWPLLRKHGLLCTMVGSHRIDRGLNRREHWDECLPLIRRAIDSAAEAGYPNVICFSGNRSADLSDEEGQRVSAEAVKQVIGHAETRKVTLCLELLNSRVDHPHYMADRTEWGVGLCRLVGSDRFKLLYDIYHMQVMEGDVIATIRRHKDFIAHYHTAGVPGRHELDDTQELNYPAIVRAIVDTGYSGWLGQEFIPKHDPFVSLAAAGRLCDV